MVDLPERRKPVSTLTTFFSRNSSSHRLWLSRGIIITIQILLWMTLYHNSLRESENFSILYKIFSNHFDASPDSRTMKPFSAFAGTGMTSSVPSSLTSTFTSLSNFTLPQLFCSAVRSMSPLQVVAANPSSASSFSSFLSGFKNSRRCRRRPRRTRCSVRKRRRRDPVPQGRTPRADADRGSGSRRPWRRRRCSS